MRKLLMLVVVIVIFLMTGCVGRVNTYTDSGQTIDIGVNQQFIIVLGSNPTTGYSWQVIYDETVLELVDGESTYEGGKEVKQGAVGAGGMEYFRFKTLKVGKTEITMVYKRSWEEEILEQKVFTVNID